jgi:hypothetical protein
MIDTLAKHVMMGPKGPSIVARQLSRIIAVIEISHGNCSGNLRADRCGIVLFGSMLSFARPAAVVRRKTPAIGRRTAAVCGNPNHHLAETGLSRFD